MSHESSHYFLLFSIVGSDLVFAQLERRRTVTDEPVEVFLTMSLITMATTSNLNRNNMNSTIMHNFGLVISGIEEFWGLDQGAAVRLGIDYGISDRLSIGIGRTSREDNVDFRVKYTVLQQMKSDKIPV
jgi:NhaP-type Na+/H+ and K+/H+ antiporter